MSVGSTRRLLVVPSQEEFGIDPPVTPRRMMPAISTGSPECLGIDLFNFLHAGPSSQNWASASLAIFIPFQVPRPLVVATMLWWNGTAVAGNIDIGIYDASGNLMVSKGSTAQAGTNAAQIVDVTDTLLMPGLYYMALASDTSGVTQKIYSYTPGNAGIGRCMGVYQQASAFALPNPATFATFAQTVIPFIALNTATV